MTFVFHRHLFFKTVTACKFRNLYRLLKCFNQNDFSDSNLALLQKRVTYTTSYGILSMAFFVSSQYIICKYNVCRKKKVIHVNCHPTFYFNVQKESNISINKGQLKVSQQQLKNNILYYCVRSNRFFWSKAQNEHIQL